MARDTLRKELVEFLGGLDGWRLEPRTTPGASPLWCFLSGGKVEFSVTVENRAIVLYVMDTDEEMTFSDREAMVVWFSENRPEALRPGPTRSERKQRARKFFEWG
jgi:hypothetical protein